ncbi:MAG: SMP-30/gluconolactonase/LRE family protein [Balneolaceae bacterium]
MSHFRDWKPIDAELELLGQAKLGEGPVWDEHRNVLLWTDILSGTLHEYDPMKRTNRSFEVGEHIGAFAIREKGGLILAAQSGFWFYDSENGKREPVADPEKDRPGNRFNDGKCDPAGRFWAGTMAYNETLGAGSLYSLTPNLDIKCVVGGLTISNGLAWSSDSETFYLIDSPTGNLYSYDYVEQTGELSGGQIVKHFDPGEGMPDGMTIDTEGMLWVALYNGGKVIRVNPLDGSTLLEIRLPVPLVTCCTFGGPDLDQLYITTAREGLNRRQLEHAPLSGSLFRVSLPWQGFETNRFTG